MSTVIARAKELDSTTPEGHGLGWKVQPKDSRDYMYKLVAPTKLKALPRRVDLRTYGYLPAIKNQGPYGSCVAHATASSIEYLEAKNNEARVPVSRAEIYWYARMLEGTQNEDSGCYIRDAFIALNRYGVAPEVSWPYTQTNIYNGPSLPVEALNRKVIEYRLIPDSNRAAGIKQALNEGNVVVFGIAVYESFESLNASRTGIIPFPNRSKERLYGGHCIYIIGYDMDKKHYICCNSWGDDWGDKGYFYLPLTYVYSRILSGDFWVMTQLAPIV